MRIWAIWRGAGAAPVDFSSIHVELDGDASILEKCFDMWELDCWVPPLPVGVHRLEIELADLRGRINSASFEFEVYETRNDRLAPRLQFLSPAEQETLVGVKAIDFTFEMADEIRGSGIDEDSFTFEVDGVDMSALCSASQSSAACRSLELADGNHLAVATIRDLMGNEARATRQFSTSRSPRGIGGRVRYTNDGHDGPAHLSRFPLQRSSPPSRGQTAGLLGLKLARRSWLRSLPYV